MSYQVDSYGNAYFPAGVSVASIPATTGTQNKVLVPGPDGRISSASISQLITQSGSNLVTSVYGRTGAVVPRQGDYDTDLVTEGQALYFTDSRARKALSVTTFNTSGPATYDSTTGIINIPQYGSGIVGNYVPVTRTITINGQTADLSADRIFSIDSMVYPSAGIPLSNGTSWGTSIVNNSANWNTAFGWGDHAGLYSLLGHTHTFASLTSIPTTLAGYGITDAATSAQGTNADTAYSWGNHALAGYLTSFTETDPIYTASTWYTTTNNATNWNTAYTWGNHALAGYLTSFTETDPIWTSEKINYYTKLQADARYLQSYTETDPVWTSEKANYALKTYVDTSISNLVDSAPTTLDTLNELAAALGDDANFSTTITNLIGTKEPAITAGTTAQYWRGDKSWQTLPVYTLSGLGGVPTTRTITINGTSYDLSADRSWSITSMIYPSAGIAVSTGSAWGTSITDNSSNWNTAYSWGNHASAGYLTGITSSQVTNALGYTPYNSTNPSGYITGNQNITLSGDVTGSGATSIVTTIANNAVTTAKINNGAVTAAKLATFGAGEGITWAANTDGASIIFESTGDGASGGRALSNLLIALTDNGDEGLKVTTTGAELLYVNTNQFQYKGSNVWTAASLTNLNQLTNGPGYITGYTETDTLSSVVARGASTTNAITANRFISNATDVAGEWYFFRGNSSVSNALTMYTYSDNVYTNAYKSYHIRANNTGGSGGYVHLHGGSIMLGTANAPNLHSSTLGVVIQGPSSSRGILEIWDGASGKSVFQNVGGTTYIGQLDKGSGSGITYILVNGNGTSADVALTLNANTSAAFNSTVTATAFLKTGGTSSQFLMADGSISTNPGWVTGGPYLPLTVSGGQTLRFDTSSGEHISYQNQTSGGAIQIGFQQNDSEGLHHRAYMVVKKSSYGNYAGRFEIQMRPTSGAGYVSGSDLWKFTLETGNDPRWNGSTILHSSNYSSYALPLSGGTMTGNITMNSKIIIQDSNNAGNTRGIYMWNAGDPNWVIYMTTSGVSSPAGGTTCAALDGSTSHAIRFRIAGSGNSFIWENTSEQCLMSLNGVDNASGGLYVKRRIRGSNGFTLSGDFGFYTSYTPDGLFGSTATPNTLSTTSNGGNLILGYQDNGSGLYSPAYGFDVRSTDGIPVAGRVVKAIVMRDLNTGAQPFIVYNNGAIYSAQNIQGSKFLVNGDSWIVFNNEEGAWGIKTRTTTSTSKLGSALKNMFFCGGGGNEGFVITGVGTGDPSFEINNNGAAFIKDRLLINTGTHWNNEKLGIQISNGNNLTNVPALVRLTNYTSGGITKMTFTDSSIIDGIFCMTPISNGSYWSLGFAGYTEQGLKVYQNGNVVAAGDVTAYSDERVKENIATVDNALEKTIALRGVYYNRTDTADKRKKIGVIAQEVEIVAPELVTRMEDDMLNVSYGNMAGLFIEAIKEQQKQIEELKNEIKELKNK